MAEVAQSRELILQEFIADLKKQIVVNKAYLYGSSVSSLLAADSDVDVAVFSESFDNEKFVNATAFLFRIARKYKDICLEPVGFPVSALREGNPFVQEILETGREIKS
jgi:predicted nucleotidyltransferase